jgi:hypothetical protein
MTPEQRTSLYTLAAVVAPLLLAYGVATESQAAAIGAALVAIVGVIVAFAHRPTKG